MSGTFSCLYFHLVFTTKTRSDVIDINFEQELYSYIAGIVKGQEGQLLKIGGTENHLHLVLNLKPSHSIPDIVKQIKTYSSKWINTNNKASCHFSWQNGYGIFSVSESGKPALFRYIENQKQWHKKISFKEEFIALLKKHGVDYDEKYLWN